MRKARIPAIYPAKEYHEDGALVSYGFSVHDLAKQSAYYVDKILKGVRPSELPIQQSRTFDLVVDMREARKLGITMPESILVLATQILE